MLSKDYVAGFLDGEGCFTISKLTQGRHQPAVIIVNTNYNIIQALSYTLNLWGIKHGVYRKDRKSVLHKSAYHIAVRRRDDVYMLCQILRPHLTIKQKNADIIIRFIEFRRIEGPKLKSTNYSDDLIREIRALNKPGRTVSPRRYVNE